MTSSSRLAGNLWAFAAVIAALAALVVAFRVSEARADTAGSRIGRYQLVHEDTGFAILDTTSGHVFEWSGGTEYKWRPISPQFDPAAASQP